MIILSDRESIGRLRRDSGCRRLSSGEDVDLIALDELPVGEGPVPFPERQAWSARFGAALGPGAPPVALVWRQGAPLSGRSPEEVLLRVRGFLERSLQSDRTALKVAAVIAIYPDGIMAPDCEPLERVGREHPVYLMNAQTRLLHAGGSRLASEIWPVPVGRLLGSLAIEPRRQAGLRAWRAVSVLGAAGDDDTIDVAAAALARQVISGIEEHSFAAVPVAGDLVPESPAAPPDDRVSTDGVPQHAMDVRGAARSVRPELPSWWQLSPTEGFEPVRGAPKFEVDARLRVGPGSAWRRAFSARGAKFVRDRFERARSAALQILGPSSVHTRAWASIHSHPGHLGWYAKGAFFRRPDRGVVEFIAAQKLSWSRVRDADDRAAARTVRARVTAHELEVARSACPSLLVRTICFVAAALFASGVVGVVTASMRGSDGLKWSMLAGGAACAGGLASAGLMMLMEWRAGQAGRDSVESDARRAESAIADTLHARLEVGSEGELLQRRTAWLQSAARVRETADRLHVIRGEDERLGLLAHGSRSVPGAPSLACVDLRRLQSATLDPPLSAESIIRSLLSRDPDLLARRRAEYLQWWRRYLRSLDPAFSGGVVSAEFSSGYSEELSSITDAMRQALREELDRIPHAAWGDGAGTGLAEAFGPSDDAPGLSCITHRARGLERARVVMVHAPMHAAGQAVSRSLRRTLHGDVVPVVVESMTDGWGGLMMVIDEITVSLEPSAVGVDGGVRVMEGRSVAR